MPPADTSTTTAIDEFKATLSEVPHVTGTVPLGANISQLFYRNAANESSGFIDFSTAVSDAQLEHLVQACQPATFGVQQKDVLDESYRKAWKMDAVDFSTNFNPNDTGIMQAIHYLLVKDPTSSARAELHKLNVYGPGSFFKAHVDTPRSPKMFGSLVVVLPTKHEGGALLLRHQDREWTFDSADIVSAQKSESPHAAFVAFFGDVEHEVSVVTSGYRVTLAYNLYFGEDEPSVVPSILLIDDTEVKMKRSLIKLLNDPNFLPDGGLLGFSLAHLYPINSTRDINVDELKSLKDTDAVIKWLKSRKTSLDKLGKFLKGTDAAIKRACNSLSLDVSVKAVYKSDNLDGVACLLDDIADICGDMIEDDIAVYIKENSTSGLIVFNSDLTTLEEIKDELGFTDSDNPPRPILWLKPLTERHQIETAYVGYGNEASLEYAYGEICLVLEVEAFKDRKTYPAEA